MTKNISSFISNRIHRSPLHLVGCTGNLLNHNNTMYLTFGGFSHTELFKEGTHSPTSMYSTINIRTSHRTAHPSRPRGAFVFCLEQINYHGRIITQYAICESTRLRCCFGLEFQVPHLLLLLCSLSLTTHTLTADWNSNELVSPPVPQFKNR